MGRTFYPVTRYLEQQQEGPHRIAAEIVERLGEKVALATLSAIAEELGIEGGRGVQTGMPV
jgi:hypothetical protein